MNRIIDTHSFVSYRPNIRSPNFWENIWTVLITEGCICIWLIVSDRNKNLNKAFTGRIVFVGHRAILLTFRVQCKSASAILNLSRQEKVQREYESSVAAMKYR